MKTVHWTSALIAWALVLTGCGDAYHTPTTPTSPAPVVAPTTPATPVGRPVTNWKADATVITAVYGDGGPCGWGTTVGESRRGVEWAIAVDGSSIAMDEDMPNWPTDDIPFKGVLHGTEFNLEYFNAPDYLQYVCRWRGATLTGRFSDDRSTFDAVEHVFWGTSDAGTTVTRRWSGYVVR